MANPILQALSGLVGGNAGAVQSGGNSILLQAVGAAMRGESPQKFMKNLAKNHPELNGLNLDDLQGTSDKLCRQRGVNPTDVAKHIDGVIDPVIKK